MVPDSKVRERRKKRGRKKVLCEKLKCKSYQWIGGAGGVSVLRKKLLVKKTHV
jgi:hypothetical protein